MPATFVEHGLNIIVKRLTGINYFCDKYEMDSNANGIYYGKKTTKSTRCPKINAEKRVKINARFVLD